MTLAEIYSGEERRARDRSAGIQLRRRKKRAVPKADDQRQASDNGFDIASALELHLDQITTRRGMIALLESWLQEAKNAEASERDENYVQAVRHAIEVMTSATDPIHAIAVLQRATE